MIVLGLILLLIGWALGIGLLFALGVALLIIGLVLWFVPSIARGRRFY